MRAASSSRLEIQKLLLEGVDERLHVLTGEHKVRPYKKPLLVSLISSLKSRAVPIFALCSQPSAFCGVPA